MARMIATVLALILAFEQGMRYAYRNGYCAYCHAAPLGPPPKDIDHWETCPLHPARVEVERLRGLVGEADR